MLQFFSIMKNEITPNITVTKLPGLDEIERRLPHGLILAFIAIPDEGIGGIGETSIAKLIASQVGDVEPLKTGDDMRTIMNERLGRELSEEEFEIERNNLTPDESNIIDRDTDILFSNRIKQLVDSDGLVIIASKLAAILMDHSEELEGIATQEALKIAIGVKSIPYVSTLRMVERQRENGETIDDIALHRVNRLEGDRKIFEEAYPNINCLNPYTHESVVKHVNFVLDNSVDISSENWDEYGKSIINVLIDEIPQIAPILLKNLS